jgi:hypothetical protein
MKPGAIIIISSLFILTSGCITKFIPDITEKTSLLVVDGMITDQKAIYTIKLSKSQPLAEQSVAKPVMGAYVTVTDDDGAVYYMNETSQGSYTSDSSLFKGETGRKYTLHIQTAGTDGPIHTYESFPMELRPVPAIDSVYWEKTIIKDKDPLTGFPVEGCQIYVDSHDNGENCKFYRWNFSETWEFHIPYFVPNRVCWKTENSYNINIKSTSSLSENSISGYPLFFISNTSDRLSVKYSIDVKQYSLSQEEYAYWGKIKDITQNVGSLYDIVPASVNGNMICVDDPQEAVLGYFSVSAESSQRLFVQQYFSGLVNQYLGCPSDTVFGYGAIQGENSYVWVIVDHTLGPPIYRVITNNRDCADCRIRGSSVRPSFWDDDQKTKK